MEKTLAIKILTKAKVAFDYHTYPESERDAIQIAHFLNLAPNTVYKTLVVVRPKGKPILVMIAADARLSLKKVAKAVGEKKVQMATHAEAEALTKLQVGGISPLALLNKGFLICIDQQAKAHPKLLISAGKKGINLGVPVDDLVRLTNARLIDAVE